MGKVVTEHPRSGQGYDPGVVRRKPNRGRVGEDYEQYSCHEGMRRPWLQGYGELKGFSDVLGPLWGYLRKSVGRPWNDVWSEMCAHLDLRSVQGFHIKSHVFSHYQGVALHVRMVRGTPYVPHSHGRWEPYSGLYVDPGTGLLCSRAESQHTPSPPAPSWRKEIDSTHQLHFIHGAWFLVTLAPLPSDRTVLVDALGEMLTAAPTRYNPGPRGVLISRRPRLWKERSVRYGRLDVYAVAKRQISRREKRRYGVA